MNTPIKQLPDYVKKYLEAVPEHRPEASVEEERKACHVLWESISKEKDHRLQQLMTIRFESYCCDFASTGPVLLSYIHSERWEDETQNDRELLARPLHLYWELEDIIAQYGDCSGYTMQTRGSGSRYPLRLTRSNGTTDKMGITFITRTHEWNPKEFMSAYYAFGVHKLYIGKAIVAMCDILEERYNLDFAALEQERLRKTAS